MLQNYSTTDNCDCEAYIIIGSLGRAKKKLTFDQFFFVIVVADFIIESIVPNRCKTI